MSKKILRIFSIVVVVLIISSSFVFADIIHLRNGGKVEGEIIEKPEIPPKAIPPVYKVKTSYGIVTLKETEVKTIEYKDVGFQPIEKSQVLPRKQAMDYYNKFVEIGSKVDGVYYELSAALNDTSFWRSKGTRFRTSADLEEKLDLYLHELKKIYPPTQFRQAHRYLIDSVEEMGKVIHWIQYDSWDKANSALYRAKILNKKWSEELKRATDRY